VLPRQAKSLDLGVRFVNPDTYPQALLAAIPKEGLIPSWVHYAGTRTQACSHFHVGSFMAMAVCDINQAGWVTRLPTGTVRHLQCWTFILAPQGQGKSTSQRMIMDMRNAITASENAAAVQLWDQQTLDRKLHPKHKPSVILPPIPRPKEIPSIFISADGTTQGLRRQFADRADANNVVYAVLFEDEFSKLLATEGILEFYQQTYDGQLTERATVQAIEAALEAGTKVFNGKLRISAIFATTPKSLRRVLAAGALQAGLMSRVAVFRYQPAWMQSALLDPPSSFAQCLVDGLPDALAQLKAYEAWLQWLRGTDIFDPTKPKEVTFSDEAQALRLGVHRLNEKRREEIRALNDDSDEASDEMAYATRQGVQALTYATVYALTQYRTVVSGEDMRQAFAMADLCISGIKDTAPDMVDTTVDYDAGVGKLFAFLVSNEPKGRAKGTRRSDITRKMRGMKSYAIKELITTLIDEGSVAEFQRKGKGRPTTVYYPLGTRRFGLGEPFAAPATSTVVSLSN